MGLDEATKRFSLMLQGDLHRLAATEARHTARGERLKYDSVSRLAIYEGRSGSVSRRLYGEVLATWSSSDRILRWTWAGRTSGASTTHGDAMLREAQRRSVPQVTMSVVADLEAEDALAIAKLGAVFARAEGLHVRTEGDQVQFVGLFERPRPTIAEDDAPPGDRFSVPPPPVTAREENRPDPRTFRSLPPIREVYEPRARTGRGSDRIEADDPRGEGLASAPPPPPPGRKESFLPVANAALTALAQSCAGYTQALVVLSVEQAVAKRRFFVQLVAVDAEGVLRSIDAPPSLVDAAARLLETPALEPFRKISARVTPKPDGGATLVVDVV